MLNTIMFLCLSSFLLCESRLFAADDMIDESVLSDDISLNYEDLKNDVAMFEQQEQPDEQVEVVVTKEKATENDEPNAQTSASEVVKEQSLDLTDVNAPQTDVIEPVKEQVMEAPANAQEIVVIEPDKNQVESTEMLVESKVQSGDTGSVAELIQMPAAPAPLSVDDVPIEDVADEDIREIDGIHTVDIDEPEGNWLFKRIWWEKSKNVLAKIRDLVDKIVESRMHFFEQRVKLDRERVDPFFVEIGFNQGALTQKIDSMLDLLTMERADTGVLSAKELEQYTALQEEKATLEKLRVLVFDIQELNSGLDYALANLMEQVNLARSYEREAWQLFDRTSIELNDEKARQYYYKVNSLWANVKNIGRYITGEFAQHFVQLGATIDEHITIIQEALDKLQGKGIQFEKEIKDRHEQDAIEEVEVVEQEEQPQVGWFTWLSQLIVGTASWPFKKILYVLGWY